MSISRTDDAIASLGIRPGSVQWNLSESRLVEQTVRPATERGELVLADRFISSTLAYQGTAGGLTEAEILSVGRVAVGDCWPDLTVIFDVDEATANTRVNPDRDRMERKGDGYHRKVREGFRAQARTNPDGYLVIDASAAPDTVFETLIESMRARL